MNYNIRQARSEDVDALTQLGRKTFALAYGAVVLPSDMESHLPKVFNPELVRSEISNSTATYYVAENESGVLGYAKLARSLKPDCVKDENVAELVRLYVDPGVYGKGIGQSLLEAVRREAVESGFSGWWLRVWEKNHAAIRFYERHGFQWVGSEPYLIGVTANPVALMFEGFE